MKKPFHSLTNEEKQVIVYKGTEKPFSGKYNDFFGDGAYTCKQCGTPLYYSEHKFPSHCGWPSFDDEIPGSIKHKIDSDGRRTEILCACCDGHLGHVFAGEMMTGKNVRHCVNSASMNFVSRDEMLQQDNQLMKTTYFAGGCFWGVEHLMQQQPGVISVVSGYMGGHIETVEISYQPDQVDFETLAKLFFEIHDPTQVDRQGPDRGEQYASAIFYHDEQEKLIVENLIHCLKEKRHNVVTRLLPVCRFWPAENNHQNYYQKNGKQPYCHQYEKKF